MEEARTEAFVVEQGRPGLRLDAFLKERYPVVSRAALQRLIAEGWIRVNGQAAKPSHVPKRGEQIFVQWPSARPAEARPEAIPLDVLYEDGDLLVINKSPGLVVHPAAGHDEHTLVNALLHHCGGELSGIGGVARPGIVHRLDKDTSGCMVVAKNDVTHAALSEQFKDRHVGKEYEALVFGRVAADCGEIRAGIARHPSHRKRMAVTDGTKGREAWTSYEVLERWAWASWVRAQLHTGRTHQIRVHFHHLGHPLVGDDVYGERPNRKLREATGLVPERQMLHAIRLDLTHPRTGNRMRFQAPRPADFERAIGILRATATGRGELPRLTRD